MEKALTVSEACARLGLSKPTALKLLKNGTLPAAKLGKSWRLSGEAIERMLCGGGGSGTTSNEPRAA